MVQDPSAIQVRPGELRYYCKSCRRWGRRSDDLLRTDFGHHGRKPDGERKYRGSCRECLNRRRRASRRKAGALERKFSHTVEFPDDYGTLVTVRLCSDCRHWLPADTEHFDRRGRQRPDLLSFCKDCRRAKQAAAYHANPEPRRAKMRERHHAHYGELRALDRALRAAEEGKPFYPRRKVSHTEQWLPTEPFGAWLRRTIPRYDELNKYNVVDGGITRLADAVGCSERHVRRLRDCKHSTVRLSDVLRFLEFAGGAVEDIWPDYEAAIEEGFRLRFENQHVPNRAAA